MSLTGYPYQSPTVKFTTPCFHPNVDNHGNICLDILKEKWSALYEVGNQLGPTPLPVQMMS